jgi:hypothetical protein
MNDPEKRACPYCIETISVKAKLCPRCRQWLTLRSFRHPLVMAFSHGLPLLAMGLAAPWMLFSWMEQFENPKPYYSDLPGSIRIQESHMNWAQTRDGLRLFVAGVLTNTSPMFWRDLEFDCRFFNARGAMIDADTGYGHVSVEPYAEVAFRVSVNPTGLTNQYATYQISVSHARNAKGWY